MKKKVILISAVLMVLFLGRRSYVTWFSVIRVAFVNFQTISMGNIARANWTN
ncbi:hypothetical protein [Odoribacter sp. Z80]|uniref:hypothetical protein n=1 Tax=Odoribacter sp. Z80 TaxID=2304575 RepID=UPI00137A0644|nr:hypothetical protein [Odoribacter sp. Z80]